MYTVKGYVGSEEKLRTYFAGCAFEKKPRVLFVTDEILSDHITCFEYLDSIRRTKNHKEPDDILEGPLTDYESWMPDFLGGLAKGIENSRAFEEGRKGCGCGTSSPSAYRSCGRTGGFAALSPSRCWWGRRSLRPWRAVMAAWGIWRISLPGSGLRFRRPWRGLPGRPGIL